MNFFVQLHNLVLFAYNVDGIILADFIITMRNYNLTVSRYSGNKHIRHKPSDLRHLKTDKLILALSLKLDKSNSSTCKNSIVQRIFFGEILVYLHGNSKIRVYNVVNTHGRSDEFEMLHVLRISDSNDDPMASELLSKATDDEVILVLARCHQHILELIYSYFFQYINVSGILVNSHNVKLLRKSIEQGIVSIHKSD